MKIDFSVFENDFFSSDEPIACGGRVEPRAVEAFFRGRRRFDVTLGDLNNVYEHDPSACLGFMLPRAFAFFLPVFMKISIIDYEEADVISDAVVRRMYDMAKDRADDNLSAVLSSYTREQLETILNFLLEMSRIEWRRHNPDLASEAATLLREKFLL
ncbi:DUF6714 family protein [Burkholderia multivorans]|uniref:DUF6714 family protein n=1 Tax=Burkholderia multivorans TaxID=87883 RepID=UPI0020A0B54B|nr:DUF6714 family protein [Burkholderia multivorans]MCO8592615.1 hypothetical protein [Burkholderia multivorans]MCO8609470.1 hypothetical protein [Burkholderia multivorans]MCO8631356.1 hypothetical protein [Burkholderia multivorans]MCO8636498.1 hypothetical protein [Burkholderia multivorans]MCO8648332.1 hypothetical protein [Burkholderia multivorans]